jgi:hypothetical protein
LSPFLAPRLFTGEFELAVLMAARLRVVFAVRTGRLIAAVPSSHRHFSHPWHDLAHARHGCFGPRLCGDP